MLYHFKIELSDVTRGVYETLDFRTHFHPSEAPPYLLTRVLAFALSYESGLAFSPTGLSDPAAPALQSLDANNAFDLWIEIGNPSAKKLHKASKAARRVKVYTYKNPKLNLEEMAGEEIHRSEHIEVFAFDPKFLSRLESLLEKNNHWSLLHQDNHIDLGLRGESLSSEVMVVREQVSMPPTGTRF